MSLIIRSHGEPSLKKSCCIFDLDNTIITTKSGKAIPKDMKDWKPLNDTVKSVLQKYAQKHAIIVVTNQKGITMNKITADEFNAKLESIMSWLCIDITFYVATDNDVYRKPKMAIIESHVKQKIKFYCGDAAGRKGDHSDTDIKFAKNIGCDFHLPEQLFITDKPYDNVCKIKYPKIQKGKIHLPAIIGTERMLIIMVGLPGSGKSTVANMYKGYEIVSNDTNGKKCQSVALSLATRGVNFIVDNTNMSITNRKQYIDMGLTHGYYIVCMEMTTPVNIAMHNMHYRNVTSDRPVLSDVVYRVSKSKYEKPTLEEGINVIHEIDYFYSGDDPKYHRFLY